MSNVVAVMAGTSGGRVTAGLTVVSDREASLAAWMPMRSSRTSSTRSYAASGAIRRWVERRSRNGPSAWSAHE